MTLQAIRVDYHAGEQASLMLDAIRPFTAKVLEESLANTVVVWPHWRCGNHVLVALDTDEETFGDKVMPLAEKSIGSWLVSNPSKGLSDAERYLKESARWAKLENERRPISPLVEDNALSRAVYDRVPPFGVPELGDIREWFYGAALEFAFDTLALRRDDRNAAFVRLACMVASVGEVLEDGRFDFWPTSLQANALGFLAARPYMRDTFEKTAVGFSDRLAQAMRDCALMGNSAGNGTVPWPLRAWKELLIELERRLDPVIASRKSQMLEFNLYGELPKPESYNSLFPVEHLPLRDAAMRTTLHLRFRVMINLVYGLCPTMGVMPGERAAMCFALQRACQEHFSDYWQVARKCARALGERAIHGDVR